MEYEETVYHLNKEKQSRSCEMVYLIGEGGGGGDGGTIHSQGSQVKVKWIVLGVCIVVWGV